MQRARFISTLFLSLLPFVHLVEAADTPPMIIKYAKFLNAAKAPQKYKLDLIELILEQTVSEYGAYHLELPELNAPGKRQAILMSEGKQINLIWSIPGSDIARANVIPIPVDILRGLAGYRVCLINRNDKTDFNKVSDLASLRSIKLGQGLGWTDIDIYRFNNIQPGIATTFDDLIKMLAANRFNCLPLGVDEIKGILAEQIKHMPMLAIEPTLLIYYEFPIYLYVSAKHPLIAERFKLGMEKILANGEFDKLFMLHFKGHLDDLHLNSRRIICLSSPNLPLENQCSSDNLKKIKQVKEI